MLLIRIYFKKQKTALDFPMSNRQLLLYGFHAVIDLNSNVPSPSKIEVFRSLLEIKNYKTIIVSCEEGYGVRQILTKRFHIFINSAELNLTWINLQFTLEKYFSGNFNFILIKFYYDFETN